MLSSTGGTSSAAAASFAVTVMVLSLLRLLNRRLRWIGSAAVSPGGGDNWDCCYGLLRANVAAAGGGSASGLLV